MCFLPINNCTTIQFVTFRTLTTSPGVKMMQFGAKLYKNIYIFNAGDFILAKFWISTIKLYKKKVSFVFLLTDYSVSVSSFST